MAPPEATAPKVAAAPQAVNDAHLYKLLAPFVQGSTWRSNAFGALSIVGSPTSGCLYVHLLDAWSLRTDGRRLFLESPCGLQCCLVSGESHPKRRAVWLQPNGLRDVWERMLPGATGSLSASAGIGNNIRFATTAVDAVGQNEIAADVLVVGARCCVASESSRSTIAADAKDAEASASNCCSTDPAPIGDDMNIMFVDAIRAGEASMRQGLAEMAAQHFMRAIDIAHLSRNSVSGDGEGLARALRGRAKARLALGEDALPALADAQRVVGLRPLCRASHHALAMARLAVNDFIGACEACTAGLRLSPELQDGPALSLIQAHREAERCLLLSRPIEGCYRTFEALPFEARRAWELCPASPVAMASGTFFGTQAPAPRQFVLQHASLLWPRLGMLYRLTVPAAAASSSAGSTERYPLVVFLHGALSNDICKGDIAARQVQFLAKDCPFSTLVDRNYRRGSGVFDSFIAVQPCCPPNVSALHKDHLPNAAKKRKVYWFKTCDALAYAKWDFSQADRCVKVEQLVVELLANICEQLPVDASRIYLVGSSSGGYAALRLAELVPELPAVFVPLAGYYPEMPREDHSATAMVERLRSVRVWPIHCLSDTICPIRLPEVAVPYRLLHERLGVEVEWVAASGSDFHNVLSSTLAQPNDFFGRLLRTGRRQPQEMRDASAYLRCRLAELQAESAASVAEPAAPVSSSA